MKTLKEVASNPSGLDSYNNYMGEIPDASWLVVLTRSRDSDTLTESNWRSALARLGGESEAVQIDRFGHWACGWWESLSVLKGSKAESIALEIEGSLEDHPVLDEDDFSELETDEAQRIWQDCYDNEERAEYIRNHPCQFEFNGLRDAIDCIKGKYFAGWACKLIG